MAGTLADGTAVTAQVEVEMVNYVLNPSFEDEDTSMWKVSYEGENNPTDFQNKADDAYTGDIAFHFWSGDSDMDFSIEQEFTDLEPGTYQLSAYAQGGGYVRGRLDGAVRGGGRHGMDGSVYDDDLRRLAESDRYRNQGYGRYAHDRRAF